MHKPQSVYSSAYVIHRIFEVDNDEIFGGVVGTYDVVSLEAIVPDPGGVQFIHGLHNLHELFGGRHEVLQSVQKFVKVSPMPYVFQPKRIRNVVIAIRVDVSEFRTMGCHPLRQRLPIYVLQEDCNRWFTMR